MTQMVIVLACLDEPSSPLCGKDENCVYIFREGAQEELQPVTDSSHPILMFFGDSDSKENERAQTSVIQS